MYKLHHVCTTIIYTGQSQIDMQEMITQQKVDI